MSSRPQSIKGQRTSCRYRTLKRLGAENRRLEHEIEELVKEIEMRLSLHPTASTEESLNRIQELMRTEFGSLITRTMREAAATRKEQCPFDTNDLSPSLPILGSLGISRS
uniref:Uncharacterized protein n=1 Tax=Compsopogon caeruleus TaxID=31354 RepID=A0A7S1XHD1_9RHOD|mmetsp:Transcript_942/g.2030  ORF Transcript_942/g.2030 Transcript_942/m.2030 type:complete len:110 (+) Transcript_942:583-912(+)